jgi:hypothetical protein
MGQTELIAVICRNKKDVEALLEAEKEHFSSYSLSNENVNQIKLKNGKKTNSARIKDIDFDSFDAEYYAALHMWDTLDEVTKIFFEANYKSKELFAKIAASCCTYAVIDENGWTCLDDYEINDWVDNFNERFIDKKKNSDYLTLVEINKEIA